MDIEATLGLVCEAVLNEAGQPAAVLKLRATALKTMGVVFQVRVFKPYEDPMV